MYKNVSNILNSPWKFFFLPLILEEFSGPKLAYPWKKSGANERYPN